MTLPLVAAAAYRDGLQPAPPLAQSRAWHRGVSTLQAQLVPAAERERREMARLHARIEATGGRVVALGVRLAQIEGRHRG